MHGRGEEVRIEYVTADASSAASLNLYDINGNSRSLGSGERLVLLALAIQSAASSLDIFDDANDNDTVNDGERLWATGTTGYFDVHFMHAGQYCGEGRVPKALGGNASAVTITGHGYIIRA